MKKILICDDEGIMRDLIEITLEYGIDAEIECVKAGDGQACLDLLALKSDFDLIICDMRMPQLSGVDVHDYNQNNGKFPFILLTGDSVESLKEIPRFNRENNCVALEKPWEREILLSTVEQFLQIQ